MMTVGQKEKISWETRKPAKPRMISLGIGIFIFSSTMQMKRARYPHSERNEIMNSIKKVLCQFKNE